MRRFNPCGLLTGLCMIVFVYACERKETSAVLFPEPLSHEWGRGFFTFTPETVISVETEDQKVAADWFAWLFAESAGFVPQVYANVKDADIYLCHNQELGLEAYSMTVTPKDILIEASSQVGFFYALQTLRFSLPPEISSRRYVQDVEWKVPTMQIEDSPGFRHRCLSLDVSDHYVPVRNIMEFIDCMAMMKLNHLHLVMDFDGGYTREDHELITDHAASLHVAVTPVSGCIKDLYAFPDDIASRLFPDIAALAQVAWSGKDVTDVMHFNAAVAILKKHLGFKGLNGTDIIYNVALAALY